MTSEDKDRTTSTKKLKPKKYIAELSYTGGMYILYYFLYHSYT